MKNIKSRLIIYNQKNIMNKDLFIHQFQILVNLTRNFCNQTPPSYPMPFQEYDSLQLLLLQECDRLKYTRNTKYLAKTYFDLAVIRLHQLDSSNACLYLLTSLAMAVKFNQNRQISQTLKIQHLVQISDSKFQLADFQRAELELLSLLDFRLQIISPYDFASLFRGFTRKYTNRRVREHKMLTLLDFAVSLPDLALTPPLYIFWACFLQVFKICFSKNDLDFVQELITNQDEVKRIKGILLTSIERLTKQQQPLVNDFNKV